MGVRKYVARRKTLYLIDEMLRLPSGEEVRFRQRGVPTREQAEALAAKKRAEAFEGRFFDKRKEHTLTVSEAWMLYEPICKRDCDAYRTERTRAKCFLRVLGPKVVASLTTEDVEAYRTARFAEKTRRGEPPAPATLDREVELLKRCINHAVACRRLPVNPIAHVKLLRRPNTRSQIVDEEGFAKLLEAAPLALRPILVVAFDSCMREQEILGLRWNQVDMRRGTISLTSSEDKEEAPRLIYLTRRTREALASQPRSLLGFVFVNPKTGTRWQEIRPMFYRAREGAGMPELWFHDLRRSAITKARRAGVPESVVMRMSGHKTRAVFDRYNIVEERDLAEAMELVERYTERVTSKFRQSSGSEAQIAESPPG
jgi:integrase